MTYVNLVAIIGAGVSVAGGLVAVISTIAGWNLDCRELNRKRNFFRYYRNRANSNLLFPNESIV